jgi:DNA repair protein RecO (recombination protein O)
LINLQRVYKAHAIVLKRIAFGETDKILTVFTREHGKLSAIAKGARRATSRLVGGTEPMTYSRMLLAVGQNLDVLTQCEVQQPFPEVRADLEKIGHATYLLELTNAALEERQPQAELFDLLLTALHVLARIEEADVAARMFELKAMRALGYEPRLDVCVRDHAPLVGPRLAFSPLRGGMLCPRCAGDGGAVIPLLPATVARMRALMDAEPRAVPGMHPSETERREMGRALAAYVRHRVDAPLRSLHFLEELHVSAAG